MIAAAERLSVGQGAFRAGPFDFVLAANSITALIGPNGAGKSTVLRTLAGLLAPLGGNLTVEARTAYLPPPGAAAPPFAADYVVVMGRASRRGLSPSFAPDDWTAAHEALARVGAADLAARRFDRLSSGQQARVMLARAIAQEARLCLLDEPTALLDPSGVAEVTATLRALAGDGRALVIATHDLDLARQADQIVTLGDDIEAGPPAKLLTAANLARLYGAPVTDCHICGHVSIVATSAAPPNSAST